LVSRQLLQILVLVPLSSLSARADESGSRVQTASPAARAAPPGARCKTSLDATFGSLGTGVDIVGRLYPGFDRRTFTVKGGLPMPLLDCDLSLRTASPSRVVVLLVFPSDWVAAGKSEGPANNAWHDDRLRFELALVRSENTGAPSIVRNRNALSNATLCDSDEDGPLPLEDYVTLDRTIFRLTEDETALAVRYESSNGTMGSNALLFERDNLALFRAGPAGLSLVFKAPLKETISTVHCDEEDAEAAQECDRPATVTKYAVHVSNHKTNGVFDLVHQSVGKRGRSARTLYQWTGTTFRPAE